MGVAIIEVTMADTTGPLTVHISAHTGLARAFIHLASVPVFLGWKPGKRAEALLVAIATRLVRFKVS